MAQSGPVLAHLLSCCDALYRELGRGAPLLGDDAYVIRAHEMSRAFGEAALAIRPLIGDAVVGPLPAIEVALRQAERDDDSGALTLYAVAMVVGPRLLVSLRDARLALIQDEGACAAIDVVAQITVREILRTGEVAQEHGPIDDELLRVAALDLAISLEKGGNYDSFGILA